MNILNVRVMGISESIIRSGYPMTAGEVESMYLCHDYDAIYTKADFDRAVRLGNAPIGSGHDCFLKGIIVQFDVCAPQYWWQQFLRYKHVDVISSQSKMHRLNEMVEVKGGSIEEQLDSVSMALEHTAGISTNYLQLKTIHAQRKNHRLKMWREVFCPWIESLPLVKKLGIIGGNVDGKE